MFWGRGGEGRRIGDVEPRSEVHMQWYGLLKSPIKYELLKMEGGAVLYTFVIILRTKSRP